MTGAASPSRPGRLGIDDAKGAPGTSGSAPRDLLCRGQHARIATAAARIDDPHLTGLARRGRVDLLLVCLPLTLAGFLHGSIVRLMWFPMLAFEVPLGRWLLAVSAIGRGSSGNVCWLLRAEQFNANPPAGLGRAALQSGVQAEAHRSLPAWRGHGRGAEPRAGHGAVGPPALEAPDGERAPGGCCGERGCRPRRELRTPVRRIKELERASGRKTMEVELLQAAGDGARQQIGFAPDCDEREALPYERHVGDVREHAAAPLRRPRGSPTTAAVALEQAPT